jgi:hypothetical protein
LVIKTLDPDRIGIQPNMPDPESMNPYPKHRLVDTVTAQSRGKLTCFLGDLFSGLPGNSFWPKPSSMDR